MTRNRLEAGSRRGSAASTARDAAAVSLPSRRPMASSTSSHSRSRAESDRSQPRTAVQIVSRSRGASSASIASATSRRLRSGNARPAQLPSHSARTRACSWSSGETTNCSDASSLWRSASRGHIASSPILLPTKKRAGVTAVSSSSGERPESIWPSGTDRDRRKQPPAQPGQGLLRSERGPRQRSRTAPHPARYR